MNCSLSLVSRKISWFYPKIPPLFNYDEEWLLLTYCLQIVIVSRPTCLLWSFVFTHCCILSLWEAKILMQAISNVHAGRRFSTPPLELDFSSSALAVVRCFCTVYTELIVPSKLNVIHFKSYGLFYNSCNALCDFLTRFTIWLATQCINYGIALSHKWV